MKSKIKSIYRYSFLVMYAIGLAIWENFLTYLADFSAFDAAYTTNTAKDAVAAIEAARQLPDASSRRAVSKKFRKLLRVAGKVSCNNFQVLLTYIEKSFPANEIETMKQAAGSSSYKKASAGNIKNIVALNIAANTFIGNNTDALVAGGMPAAFPAAVTSQAGDFDKLNTSYTAAIQSVREETNAKTAANNAVYTTLARLVKDAKVIFINDPVKRAFFTYDLIAMRFKKEGKTGCRFIVKEKISEAPLAGANVIVQPGNISVFTGKKGFVQVELQKDIVYTYTIILPGHGTVSGSGLRPAPGVIKRLETSLAPAAATA